MSDCNRDMMYQKRMQKFKDLVSVYPVSCELLAAGRSDREWLDGVLAGGARLIQLRDKKSDDNILLQKAKYFREKTREADALFIVNDRIDIALMADADGVHVGQGDLPPADIRRIAPDMIIGLSCNTKDQVLELAEGGDLGRNPVSYYNIGPIFSTETKEGLKRFLGIDAIKEFSDICSLPFTIMGGIKDVHVPDLMKAGAKRIAVVTAISQAVDIRKETTRWMNLITENKKDE